MGLFFFISCGAEVESNENVSEDESQIEELSDTIATDSIDNALNQEDDYADLSYANLKADIDNSLWIKRDYLQGASEFDIRGQLIYHRILKETDNYLFISTGGDCDAGVECYYLISFSTEDGQMVSYLDKGQLFEAGSPDKFEWISENEFTLSNYTYDLIENEWGDYEQGELLDSTITQYSLGFEGEIEKK